MTDSEECCGWAAWGELAGMGDGRVRVDAWEEWSASAAGSEAEIESTGDALQAGVAARAGGASRHSGQRARAVLAVSRWKLAERNKRG